MQRVVTSGPELTAPHRKIYPRPVRGPLRRLRWTITTVLQALLFVGPWLSWNGRQAVWLDLQGRVFHVFGWSFWPQDTYFLLLVLIILALTLFASTALAGRLWCGYACPQTLLTEMFVVVERFFEGGPARAIRRDRGPWNASKALRKTGKFAVWTVMAVWLAVTLEGFFTPVRAHAAAFFTGRAGAGSYGLAAAIAAFTLFNFGWFREQFCQYVCPYARFQGAMFDADTLIVGYDRARGEPRGKAKDAQAGDCVDCRYCVQACPMGIDIRDGLQLECIACTACLDACDTIMDKLGRPRGLVRYSSLNALQGRASHIVRPRLVVYGLLLFGLVALFCWLLAVRSTLDVNVVRTVSGSVFQVTPDGRVANLFSVKIINKDQAAHRYRISLAEFPTAQLVMPEDPVPVPADSDVDIPAMVVHPKADLRVVQHFDFIVQDVEHPAVRREIETSFVGPG